MSVNPSRDTKYLANNAAINSWKNLFSSSNDFNQLTGANQPQFILNQLNGRPIIRFDGTSDNLVSNFNFSYTANPNVSGFILYKWLSGGTTNQALMGNDNGFDRFLLLANSSYGPGVSTGGGVTSVTALGNQNVFQLIDFEFQNGVSNGSRVWANGALVKTYTEGHSGTQLTTTTLGAINPTGGYSKVDVAALVLYPMALSDTVRTRVRKYIADVYQFAI